MKLNKLNDSDSYDNIVKVIQALKGFLGNSDKLQQIKKF